MSLRTYRKYFKFIGTYTFMQNGLLILRKFWIRMRQKLIQIRNTDQKSTKFGLHLSAGRREGGCGAARFFDERMLDKLSLEPENGFVEVMTITTQFHVKIQINEINRINKGVVVAQWGCGGPVGDVLAQRGCGGSVGMWWLSWGCGGSVGSGNWVNQTATQQFRVRSWLPPQSPEGRQEL
jgi:hypothetical protein